MHVWVDADVVSANIYSFLLSPAQVSDEVAALRRGSMVRSRENPIQLLRSEDTDQKSVVLLRVPRELGGYLQAVH